MRAIIAGIPGAGKTTVLSEALKHHRMEVINYGDVMFEMARQEGIEKRDDMRTLPQETQRNIQKRAAEKIAEKEDVIIDTHCTVKTPYGYLPGLPHEVLMILRPERIILVETSPEEIAARREKDADIRKRDAESIEEMHLHQMMNRMAAMSYAVLTGATVKIVQNREGKIEEAARELARALE
ncbi:MAG: adenylate kinase [Thermoplasmata archaeon]|nr:MAG: adenylate kinase [Thermoplasmata archaeon]